MAKKKGRSIEREMDKAAQVATKAALQNTGQKAEALHKVGRQAAEISLTIAQARRHARGE